MTIVVRNAIKFEGVDYAVGTYTLSDSLELRMVREGLAVYSPQKNQPFFGFSTQQQSSSDIEGVAADNSSGQLVAPDGSVLTAQRTYSVKSVSEIQSVHDQLVADGGGLLQFDETINYVWDAQSTGVTINSAMVDVDFARAKQDFTNAPAGLVAYTFTNNFTGAQLLTKAQNRFIINAFFVKPGGGTATDSGVVGMNFDNTLATSSNRVIVINPQIYGLWKGISFGSRSYFVRLLYPYISWCRHGLYQEASPVDFAEMVTIDGGVLGDNYSHLTDVGGQVWRFTNTSFDYHKGYIFNGSNGSKLYADNCHFEWKYGEQAGETLSPFTLSGANTSVFIGGSSSVMAYIGAGQSPAYDSVFSTDNSSNKVVMTLGKSAHMSKTNSPTSLNSWVLATSNTFPVVNIKCDVDGVSVDDVPACTVMSEQFGASGLTRNGINDPFVELGFRISTTGTAAISNVTVNENGVTRKNGKNMLKITGQGRVVINLPVTDTNRRMAWWFFANTAFLTGSATVRERQSAFMQKFDGTNITTALDTRNAYSPTTVTLNPSTDVWNRVSWQNCNTSFYTSPRQNTTVLCIEIDTTLMSAGALYLSYFGYDYT